MMNKEYDFLSRNSDIERALVNIVYVILTFAVFNDILRIPETEFTFYRICLPICVCLILMRKQYAKPFIFISISFSILSIVQQLLFYNIYRSDLTFSFSINIRIYILYILIFIIFFLVKYISDIEKDNFESRMMNYLVIMGFAVIIITFLDRIDETYYHSQFFGSLEVDNENNYGCSIAAIFPFFLAEFREHKRIRDVIGVASAIFVVYFNDSKAVLFGMMVQLIIFLCIYKKNENRKQFFLNRYLIIVVMVFLIVILFIINPSIHGYSLRGTVGEPILRIIENNPYSGYTSSISYRTNTTLFCINTLFGYGILGLGIGNTGVLLKEEFPNLNPEWQMAINSPTISLHNSWLEFALDIGIVAVIVYFIIIKYLIKIYFTKFKLTTIEVIRVLYIASFPIWSISASGIYTIYFVFITMAFLIFDDNKGKGKI